MLFLQYPRDKKKLQERFRIQIQRDPRIEKTAIEIIDKLAREGDRALVHFTEKFDKVKLTNRTLRVTRSELKAAWDSLRYEMQSMIRKCARHIREFHKHQQVRGYSIRKLTEATLSYRMRPLSSVGIYVPGGTAAYPSSLLMNAIPAQIAGVPEIVAVTPPGPKRAVNPLILGAAHYLGIEKLYRVGGAQAVAALAFGTRTIPRVDKVVGPGNAYVTAAKRHLFGVIDIDMIAGPSEILVIADDSSPMSYIVADLFSQAEHDTLAVPILIYIGKLDRGAFLKEIDRQLETAPRRKIIMESLENQGICVTVKTRNQAVELANLKAPEHLELLARKPGELVDRLVNAGAIFVGPYSPEPLGDYVAGPNHVLPTGGTARFFSPLSVSSFMKATSILRFTKQGFRQLASTAAMFAEEEGLPAHARAVRMRMEDVDQERKKR